MRFSTTNIVQYRVSVALMVLSTTISPLAFADDKALQEAYLRGQRCIDYDCAMEHYRPAAEKGYAPAQEALGSIRLICSRDDRRCDVRKGLYWMEKAAKQGWAKAESKMGDFYLFGLNEGRVRNTVANKVVVVAQDYGKARGWYEKAAAQDYPDALLRLGHIYEQGLGVKANKKQARRYYERLAGQGNIEGQKRLAILDGKPLPQEPQGPVFIPAPSNHLYRGACLDPRTGRTSTGWTVHAGAPCMY